MSRFSCCVLTGLLSAALWQPLHAQTPAAAAPAGAEPGPPPGGRGAPPPEDPPSNAIPSSIQTYKTVGDLALSAHIFNPAGHSSHDKSPALLYFHGGGMRIGSPSQGYALGELLSARGVVVLAMQYRLTDKPGRTLTEIIADAKSAVRWVRANAKSLGVDPDKIVVSGHSSGAYLAAATALLTKFDEAGENTRISSVPNAMVLWSVPIRRSEQNTTNLLPQGATLDDVQPENFVRSSLPPSTFIHGSADPIASPQIAQEFEAKLQAAGNKTEFHLVAGVDHFFAKPEQRAVVYDLFAQFLSELGYIKK